MKIYAIKAYGHYGGGMAIVAAEDEIQAMDLASSAESSPWRVKYKDPQSIVELPLVCNLTCEPPCVIEHYETGE